MVSCHIDSIEISWKLRYDLAKSATQMRLRGLVVSCQNIHVEIDGWKLISHQQKKREIFKEMLQPWHYESESAKHERRLAAGSSDINYQQEILHMSGCNDENITTYYCHLWAASSQCQNEELSIKEFLCHDLRKASTYSNEARHHYDKEAKYHIWAYQRMRENKYNKRSFILKINNFSLYEINCDKHLFWYIAIFYISRRMIGTEYEKWCRFIYSVRMPGRNVISTYPSKSLKSISPVGRRWRRWAYHLSSKSH